jgi:probable F420-dependent oxidoreductase
LGTSICLVPQRDPIQLAKEVATIDFVSSGRFEFGVGAGWLRQELEDHGTRFEVRFKVMRERIEANRRIWTEDEAEYHSSFVNFEKLKSWPKPIQKPHPPVLIGGYHSNVLQRVLEFGDGWIVGLRADVLSLLPQFRHLAHDAGRPDTTVTFHSREQSPAELDSFARAGVDRWS